MRRSFDLWNGAATSSSLRALATDWSDESPRNRLAPDPISGALPVRCRGGGQDQARRLGDQPGLAAPPEQDRLSARLGRPCRAGLPVRILREDDRSYRRRSPLPERRDLEHPGTPCLDPALDQRGSRPTTAMRSAASSLPRPSSKAKPRPSPAIFRNAWSSARSSRAPGSSCLPTAFIPAGTWSIDRPPRPHPPRQPHDARAAVPAGQTYTRL